MLELCFIRLKYSNVSYRVLKIVKMVNHPRASIIALLVSQKPK